MTHTQPIQDGTSFSSSRRAPFHVSVCHIGFFTLGIHVGENGVKDVGEGKSTFFFRIPVYVFRLLFLISRSLSHRSLDSLDSSARDTVRSAAGFT